MQPDDEVELITQAFNDLRDELGGYVPTHVWDAAVARVMGGAMKGKPLPGSLSGSPLCEHGYALSSPAVRGVDGRPWHIATGEVCSGRPTGDS